MSEKKPLNKKVILAMFIPIAVLLVVFIISQNGPNEDVASNEDTTSLGFMNKKVNEQQLNDDKFKAYEEKERLEREQYEYEMSKTSSVNDMFSKNNKEEDVVVEQTQPIVEEKPIQRTTTTSKPRYYQADNTIQPKTVKQPTTTTNTTTTNTNTQQRRSFYSSDNSSSSNKTTTTSSPDGLASSTALVHNEATITTGQSISIRTIEDLKLSNGNTIPKGTYLRATSSFAFERVHFMVTNYSMNNQVYPCKIELWDTDGNKGLYSPTAISQDINKEAVNSTNDAGTKVTMKVPVLGSITTNAAAKKINNPTITIPKNYKVILREMKY